MKFIVLIHAHKEPGLLNRLIRALADERFTVYVNLDLKSDIDPASIDARARLIKRREEINWGDFSQVQATLNSFAEIDRQEQYDYLIYISGQDYPVWSSARIAQFLESSDKKQYMHHTVLGQGGWEAAAPRVDYYHYSGASAALKLVYGLSRKIMRLLSLKRKLPGGLVAYGGSNWFTITRECVGDILAFVMANPGYVDYMKKVFIPDEEFFQTIVLNSRHRDGVVNDGQRYIDWSQRLPSPKCLTEADFDKIVASGKMFCRKIESVGSATLLERLDAYRQAR